MWTLALVAACAPSEPPSRPAGTRNVRVSVFDSRGNLVPDSGVWLERNSGAIPWRAWTDEAGECELRLPELPPLDSTIRVRTREGRSASWEYDGRSATVQVVLPRTAPRQPARRQPAAGPPELTPVELSGVVMCGLEPARGARVLLRRASVDEPSLSEVKRVLAGESLSGYLLTSTDEQGRFRVVVEAGGHRPAYWSVWAGAPGWATRHPVALADRKMDIFGPTVDIALVRVVGAIVEFRDRGARVEIHDPNPGGSLLNPHDFSSARDALELDDLNLLLAGALERDLAPSMSGERVLWESEDPAKGVIRRVEPFGYRAMDLELNGNGLESGLPLIQVDLDRDAKATGGFGGLLLALAKQNSADNTLALRGRLVLCDERGREYRYPANFEQDVSVPIPFVPTGTFSANFHFDDGRQTLIADRLLVQPGWADLELALAR